VFKSQHRHKNIFCIEEYTPSWILDPQADLSDLENDGDFVLI
jgi:hypothetical protein